MSETYDTLTTDTTLPIPELNGRCIEAIDHGGAYFYVMVYIEEVTSEIVYAYGDTNSWTSTQITGPGSAIGYDTAAILHVSMAIDHNIDEVHLAFISNNHCYHAKLTDPDVPGTAGNWQDYGGSNWQQVDNATHNANGTCSICVDNGLLGNGADDPHIVWTEDYSGAPHVHYNDGTGANDAFTPSSEVVLWSTGTQHHPTIINIANEGRQLYVAAITGGGMVLEVLRCINADDPGTLTNWKGPETGTANVGDPLWGLGFGDTWHTPQA